MKKRRRPPLAAGALALELARRLRRRHENPKPVYSPERGRERENRLRALRAARPKTLGYIGGCDQEQGVIKSAHTHPLAAGALALELARRLCSGSEAGSYLRLIEL